MTRLLRIRDLHVFGTKSTRFTRILHENRRKNWSGGRLRGLETYLFVTDRLEWWAICWRIVYKLGMGQIIDMLEHRSRRDVLSDVHEFEKLCAVLGAMQIPVEDFLEVEDEDSGRYRVIHQQMLQQANA